MGAIDPRQKNLRDWVAAQLGPTAYSLSPASSDASFRSYWRVSKQGSRSFIAMDAPPEKEDCATFLRVAGHLARGGVHTPEIFAADLGQGFVLMEDLGAVSYADALSSESAHHLYDEALATLAIIARMDTTILPPYESQRFDDEMELFRTWLVEEQLGLRWSASEAQIWQESKAMLIDSAMEQPRVFVHRDYHSRNLMVCRDHNPGVLDFQDALVGPITYDLVSLLKDCYVSWPQAWVQAWQKQYRSLVSDLLPDAVSEDRWHRWFDWMGVQRHLKAAGIFVRLHLRDGKPGYLADIPCTLAYVTDVCNRYEKLQNLGNLVARVPEALEQTA